jgi:hypothetical protein
MSAPAWLPPLLAALMLAVAGFLLWRLIVAAAFDYATDPVADLFHIAAAQAVAGMLVSWMRTLPPAAWAALFAVAAAWFAVCALRARRVGDTGSSQRAATNLMVAAVLVYMPLAGVAPSAIRGSSAGMYSMAGMPGMSRDTTIHLPALGLLLAAGALGYVVLLIERLSTATPADAARGDGGVAQHTARSVMTPRLVACCRILLLAVMAYDTWPSSCDRQHAPAARAREEQRAGACAGRGTCVAVRPPFSCRGRGGRRSVAVRAPGVPVPGGWRRSASRPGG